MTNKRVGEEGMYVKKLSPVNKIFCAIFHSIAVLETLASKLKAISSIVTQAGNDKNSKNRFSPSWRI